MKIKFYLLFVFLIYVVTVNSQSCKLKLDCQDNGTYTSTDLVYTKTIIKKAPEKQHLNVKMVSIDKIRKRTSFNKKQITKNEKSIKVLEDINKITVKNITTLLRQGVLLSEESSQKIKDLYG